MTGNIALLEQYLQLYQSAFAQDEDPKELINDLLAVFRNYSFWEQQLNTLASQHAPMQEILNKISEVIRNPFLVFDLEGNLLGSTYLDKASFLPEFAYVKHYGKMAASTLTMRFVDRNGIHRPDLTDIPQLTHPEGVRNSECMSMYLSIDGERVGYCMLVILDESELELDSQFILFLRRYLLEAEEFTSVNSPARSNRTIISDLISGKGASDEAIAKFLEYTGIAEPFQLIAIASNGIVNYTQRSMLIRDIKKMDFPLFVLDYDSHVLVITCEPLVSQILDMISESINQEQSNLSIGISMPLFDLQMLPTAYHQTQFAIEEGAGNGVFYCKDFAFSYLMRTLAGADMAADLLHPAVDILSRYDTSNQTELLKTLTVYLQEACNQIHTAETLFIHRNTLKYRLGRIVELTHINFDDPEEKLYLELSLRLASF